MNFNFQKTLMDTMYGVIHGNLPEIAGVIGVYQTFHDKPYVLELAMDQITGSALSNSAVGAVTNLAASVLTNKSGGGNGRRRRNRRNRRGKR